MKCPNCSTEMEREDKLAGGGVANPGYPNEPLHEIPAADYVCPDCGYHARWQAIKPHWTVLYDPKEEANGG